MNYKEKSMEIKDDIITNRRILHKNPEIRFDLENTLNLVISELKSYGYEPKKVGKAGVSATVGTGSPVVLLRGDMDALPMDETTGLDFASKNGATHSCGHDGHTSMLLGAAKLLKENEENLKGTVKFMFQPAEEILKGAKDMIENGILENPKVDAAIGIHIFSGEEDTNVGTLSFSRGQAMSSADAFEIKITGKQAHGSTPEKGVDAVIIGCHIAISLQNIIAREISMFDNCVVLVGKINGGDTVNTAAGSAVLEVSTRANNEESRAFLKKRVEEISKGVASTFRATVEINHTMGSPSLFNDVDLSDDVLEITKNFLGEDKVSLKEMIAGTEDFAYVALEVPAVMIHLGGGTIKEGYKFGMHNPSMIFDEDILPLGASIYAEIATKYLEKHSK